MNNDKEKRYKENYYLCHASRKQLISLIKDLNRKVNTLIVMYNNLNQDYLELKEMYRNNILGRSNERI